MDVLIAILGLAVLIFLHEAGHFLAARAVGMRPRKFYLGFPPALLKTTRGGVEYGLGAIPLGGYVKLPGMHRPAPGDLRASLAPEQAARFSPQLEALDGAIARGDDAARLEQQVCSVRSSKAPVKTAWSRRSRTDSRPTPTGAKAPGSESSSSRQDR